MTTPGITLCMIVKNEAQHLERCLSSVQGLVSEIIIADTGSIDNSKDIARKFDARVIDIPWEHDFAKARNMGLLQASYAWILVLDADEAAINWTEDLLRELLCAAHVQGYWLPITHYVGSAPQGDYVTDHVCRLFRNDERIIFQGRIHEEVASSIWDLPYGNISYAELPITHYGYLDDELQRKNKHDRNLALINQGLRLHPESPSLRYALGAEYYQQGQYSEAADILLPLLSEISLVSGYASDMYLKTAYALHQSNRKDEAETVFSNGYLLFPDFTDFLESYAQLLIEQGDLKKAHHLLKQALLSGDTAHKYPSSSGSGTYRTELATGRLCEKMWLYLDARNHYETALQYVPNDIETWRELVPLCLLTGETTRLIDQTFRNIDSLSPVTLSLLLPAALNARVPEWLDTLSKAPQLPISVQAVIQVLLEVLGEQKYPPTTSKLEDLLDHRSDRPYILGYLWAVSCRNEDMESANKWLASLITYRPGLLSIQHILEGYSGVPASFSDLAYALQLLLQCGAWSHLLMLYQQSNPSSFQWFKLPHSLLHGLLQAPDSIRKQWCSIYLSRKHHYNTSIDSAEWLLYAAIACSCGIMPKLHSEAEQAMRRSGGTAITVGLSYHKLLLAAENHPCGIPLPSGSIPWLLLVRSASRSCT